MDTRERGVATRLMLWLAAAAALSGCVYPAPYPATYAYDDAPATGTAAPTYYYYPSYYYPYRYYPYYYGYPAYVGPPLSLSFRYYHHHGGYAHGSGHGWGGHGWRGGHGHGWGGHGGFRGGGHGRH